MFDTRHLKRIDFVVGRLASNLFTRPVRKNIVSDIRSILIIRPGGIGDAVLLLPVIAVISKCFPGAIIEVLAERRNMEVFTWCPRVSRIWRYDHLSGVLGIFRGTYDIVIDSEQRYYLSAVVARMTRAPRIIGFAGNGREQMLTDAMFYDLGCHESKSFRSLLDPLGCKADLVTDAALIISPDSTDRAEELLSPIAGKQFIAIFPGASVPEKIWPVARFRDIAQTITDLGFVPVVVGGRGEQAAGELIISGLAGLNLAGQTSLSAAAAVVARSSALVSGDSGLLHVASASGTPTIALFGPSNWRKWGPRGEKSRIISTTCPCSPCSRYGTIPQCPHHQCMESITVDQVTAAIAELLAMA